ncbi:MAG: T9SS type A sorting domain-containing protein [Bacteroidetes bacterium]|nr:T9SS type A sorting domain-containing protein [Bacteroidota bacterium]
MRNLIFVILTVSVIIIFSGFDKSKPLDNVSSLDFKKIDANQISTFVGNTGGFDRNPVTFNSGFEWPKGSGMFAVYSSGLWISCRVGDSIRVSLSDYDSEYRPGYFDYNTQMPMGAEDPNYRLYKVSPDFPNGNNDFDSWNLWPVGQGAPWVDNNGNGIYEPPADNPLMKGDQNLFCSFTDGYRDSVLNSRSAPPLKAEIHMYAWAKTQSVCADVINYEWKIINKNVSAWNDFSSAIWSDIDIGSAINDKGGSDSVKNLVYGYNGTNQDPVYGPVPPAVGVIIKEVTGHLNSLYKSDYATVFKCGDGECPRDSMEVYNVMHGFKRDGSNAVNPITNQITRYKYSGDPVSGIGWNDSTSGDRYIFIGSLIGTVQSLDTADFKTISIIKKGSNNLSSVAELKNCVNFVISVNNISSETPGDFKLYQNYPNPFNPSTMIRFDLVNKNFVTLKIFDVLGREIKTLVNSNYAAGTYEVDFNAAGLPSGIYYYTLKAGGFSDSKKLMLIR